MNRMNSRHRLRPPSPARRHTLRPPYTTLPLRIPDNSLQAAIPLQSSSSPSTPQQNSAYPISIAPDKLEKALRLYANYRKAQAMAQLEATDPADPEDDNNLLLPNTPTARSRTSVASSRRHGTSVSSMYDATEATSIISFDGSPSTANELVAFTGVPVRTRVRRAFGAVDRARTALIRWLGSCSRCRERRVQCNLEEHHDIATLERLHAQGFRGDGTRSHRRSRSSTTASPQGAGRSASHDEQAASGTSQINFVGIGQNPQLLQSYSSTETPHNEVQSPGGMADPLLGINAISSISSLQFQPTTQHRQDRYFAHQDGGLLHIGLQMNNFYLCQHLDGCTEYFGNAEALQAHFERDHFRFLRLDRPYKYFCSGCMALTVHPATPCQVCGPSAHIQTWICGQYFRLHATRQQPADGPTPVPHNSSSASSHSAMFVPEPTETGWGRDAGNGYGNAGIDPFTGNTHGYTQFGGTGNPGYEYDPSQGSNYGQEDYQSNDFRSASNMLLKCLPIRASPAHTLLRQWHNFLLLLSLLLAVTLLWYTYGKILSLKLVSQLEMKDGFREHLPKIGFIAIFASFLASFTIKQLGGSSPTSQFYCPSFLIPPTISFLNTWTIPLSNLHYSGYL